jgi:hypothetical protein
LCSRKREVCVVNDRSQLGYVRQDFCSGCCQEHCVVGGEHTSHVNNTSRRKCVNSKRPWVVSRALCTVGKLINQVFWTAMSRATRGGNAQGECLRIARIVSRDRHVHVNLLMHPAPQTARDSHGYEKHDRHVAFTLLYSHILLLQLLFHHPALLLSHLGCVL